MIICARCRLAFPDARRLISHLVTEHLVSPTTATGEAQKAALNARIDQAIVGTLKDGAARYAPGPIVMVPKGTAAPILTPPKETPMPQHRKMADPAACQVCAKLAKKYGPQTKCKRHGGAGLSTSNGGGGPKKEPAPKRVPREPSDARLESKLSAAKSRVTQLRADLAIEEMRVQIISDLVGA